MIMVLPLTPQERSYPLEKQGNYAKWPAREQFREQVFPCTCGRGELRRQWQGYRHDATEAWSAGWRRKHHHYEEMRTQNGGNE